MNNKTFTQAKKFLNNISQKDNVAIIYHNDGDGFCSGLILNNFTKTKTHNIKTFAFINSISTLKKFKLKKFNKLIVIDVPAKLLKNEIADYTTKQILYIDHHEKVNLPKQILYHSTKNDGYIPCSRTAYDLTNNDLLLALIGTIADSGELYKENKTFVNNTLKKLDITLKNFQQQYVHLFCNTITYFHKNPQKAFNILSNISIHNTTKLAKYSNKIEKEIEKTLKKAKTKKESYGKINIYLIDPKYPVKGIISSIVSKEHPNKIHLIISTQKKFINISARYQSPKANLPKLLEKLTTNLEYAKTGGHPRAAGGQILKKDLKRFKQNLKELEPQ